VPVVKCFNSRGNDLCGEGNCPAGECPGPGGGCPTSLHLVSVFVGLSVHLRSVRKRHNLISSRSV